jgi:hypothetical protein
MDRAFRTMSYGLPRAEQKEEAAQWAASFLENIA